MQTKRSITKPQIPDLPFLLFFVEPQNYRAGYINRRIGTKDNTDEEYQ